MNYHPGREDNTDRASCEKSSNLPGYLKNVESKIKGDILYHKYLYG